MRKMVKNQLSFVATIDEYQSTMSIDNLSIEENTKSEQSYLETVSSYLQNIRKVIGYEKSCRSGEGYRIQDLVDISMRTNEKGVVTYSYKRKQWPSVSINPVPLVDHLNYRRTVGIDVAVRISGDTAIRLKLYRRIDKSSFLCGISRTIEEPFIVPIEERERITFVTTLIVRSCSVAHFPNFQKFYYAIGPFVIRENGNIESENLFCCSDPTTVVSSDESYWMEYSPVFVGPPSKEQMEYATKILEQELFIAEDPL